MENRLFIDVNVIQSVPPSCINRDDTGSPKTAMYGGVRRARVSSQSWKKAVRDEFRLRFDEKDLAMRTKKIVGMVAERISALDGSISDEEAMKMATDVLEKGGIKVKAKSKKKDETTGTPEAQALFFMSLKQANNLAELAISGSYDKKSVIEALNRDRGVEIGLFGRMVADDPSMNSDATCQVAHSISTHKVDNEFDYFTAVDDKAPEDNAGAGMIGTVEFNSATLYRYATISVHGLMDILGDREATAKAVSEFVRAFLLTMPTGKQNTFANRTVPYAVYIAARKDQPVNLVGAFERPVLPSSDDGGYNKESASRMMSYEKTVESEFVEAPLASWFIGESENVTDSPSNLQDALDGLSDLLMSEDVI